MWRNCDGKIDMFILGAGGNHYCYKKNDKLRERCPSFEIVCVDPVGSNPSLPESLNKTVFTSLEVNISVAFRGCIMS